MQHIVKMIAREIAVRTRMTARKASAMRRKGEPAITRQSSAVARIVRKLMTPRRVRTSGAGSGHSTQRPHQVL